MDDFFIFWADLNITDEPVARDLMNSSTPTAGSTFEQREATVITNIGRNRTLWPGMPEMTYSAVIFEQDLNNWAAGAPDLPGCITTGAMLEDTERSRFSEGVVAKSNP
jgi:hypothetical protein